ncbi:lipid asymmetry maintenance protein MlaB [Rodentibacter pneumotropicus]|uniref:STAS domain-containing protein n=1 Tax=Rodentibacter pneumotropicus TaxID=758 RepID=A0A4S2Q1F9_9PAST|nr:lipid asymmetry maintenance protein MlaB [Rodentibacter pneumotropicus]MDC2825321.1 lipid asymmetry maintenance protein MlaB [Rodentibacter pneumotropicus]THA09815.1 STAS domain-containing protein [Rodentibacter pneumotropicus]
MTRLNWDLIQNNDKIALRFSGELSRNTLLALWQQRASFLSEAKLNQSVIEWDLTGVTKIDSAGFALLCDFLYDSKKLPNKMVRLVNPPQQLLTLADLVNLSDWIAAFTDHHYNGNPNGTARN